MTSANETTAAPKALDASAGIAAHEHTKETGHSTTVYSSRYGLDWYCQVHTCESYGA